MNVSSVTSPKSAPFPAKEVEDCVRDALKDHAGIQSILHDKPAMPMDDGSWEPDIDSLVVVEIILSIEELLGVTLPQSFIPRGGYQSIDDCVADLVGQASKVWTAHTKREATYA
jgi:acyl carrier protein